MARAIKQGQHIFIAFQDGKAVLDSQLRPRKYKSREQFEKSVPAWRDGKAELVEYAPTLTPPNAVPPCYQPDVTISVMTAMTSQSTNARSVRCATQISRDASPATRL